MNAAFEADEIRWSRYMAAALRGDARLYEQLLLELGRAIEQYVRSRFGPLWFIEDCVQECLLAIHAGKHTFNPCRPFRPWMFTIVHHKTVDLLRRSYSSERCSRNFRSAADEAYEYSPESRLEAGELLDQLDPNFAKALTLTKVQGFSLKEAAAQAGISESAMKSRVARAVRAAEELLLQELQTT